MTRDDVAHLVIRTFALWLAATGLATLGPIPWMIEGPGGRSMIVMIGVAYLSVAALVWVAAPRLTRAMFARPDHGVPFALTVRGVPALAAFVTGLLVLSGAVPQAIVWIVLQVVGRSNASLFDSRIADAFDQRSLQAAAQFLAQIVVGVALLALSRRPDFWPIPDTAANPRSDEPEPPPA